MGEPPSEMGGTIATEMASFDWAAMDTEAGAPGGPRDLAASAALKAIESDARRKAAAGPSKRRRRILLESPHCLANQY